MTPAPSRHRFSIGRSARSAAAAGYVVALAGSAAAAAPTITALASFNGTNGGSPQSGLALDANGYLYGTTHTAGQYSQGTVFQLAPPAAPDGPRALTTLLNFSAAPATGQYPVAGVTLDAAGNLYGTTSGGNLAYALPAPAAPGGPRSVAYLGSPVTVVSHATSAGSSGLTGGLLADPATGTLYGVNDVASTNTTTPAGSLYQIGPATTPGGTRPFTTLYAFSSANRASGFAPVGTLVADPAGNLYGVAAGGGTANNGGTVFELTAPAAPGGARTLLTLAALPGTPATPVGYPVGTAGGATPVGGLSIDAAGNLYGVSQTGGLYNNGTVFELPAPAPGTTARSYLTLATFVSTVNGALPYFPPIVDAAGNLFGTANSGPTGNGVLYELPAPTVPNGPRTLNVIATFAGTNGKSPQGGLIAGPDGTLYGTTTDGGTSINPAFGGVVYAVTNSGYVVPVPEPAAVVLAVIGPALACRRRRHHGPPSGRGRAGQDESGAFAAVRAVG